MKININLELDTGNAVDVAVLNALADIVEAKHISTAAKPETKPAEPETKPTEQEIKPVEPETKPTESQATTRTRRTRTAAPVPPPAEPTQPAPEPVAEPAPATEPMPELPIEAPMKPAGETLDYHNDVQPVLMNLIMHLGSKEQFVTWLRDNYNVENARHIQVSDYPGLIAKARALMGEG